MREGGRKGEREGEKHQCVVASQAPTTGDQARNPAGALTENQIAFTLVHRPALNPLSCPARASREHFKLNHNYNQFVKIIQFTKGLNFCLWTAMHLHRE